MPSKPLSILLADDHAVVRNGFRHILAAEWDMQVVGEASNGREAVDMAEQLKPDVVVMDVTMPELNGIEASRRIAKTCPRTRILALSMHKDAVYVREILRAGAHGYLLKDAPAEDLAEALRKVHRGGRAIDPQLAVEAWSDADPLNDRERQVLRLAGEGQSAGDIAKQLNLSQGTVRNYLSEAIGKLGVANRIEAYRLARQRGWL